MRPGFVTTNNFSSKTVLQAGASVIMNHCSWWEPRIEVTCLRSRQETWEIIWQIGLIFSILTQLSQLTGFISSSKFDELHSSWQYRADSQGEGDCRKWISDNKKTHIFTWHLSPLSALFIEVKIQVQKFNSGPGQNQLISISSECQNLSLQIQNVKYYPGDPNSVFSLTEYFLFQLWQSNHSNRQAGTWDPNSAEICWQASNVKKYLSWCGSVWFVQSRSRLGIFSLTKPSTRLRTLDIIMWP